MTSTLGETSSPEASTTNNSKATPTDEQLKILWQGTPEGARATRVKKILCIPLVLVGFYLGATLWWSLGNAIWQKILFEFIGLLAWFVGSAFIAGMFEAIYVQPRLDSYQIYHQRQQLLDSYQTDLNASLELRDLWVLNQRRLDLYHQIATNQAKSSFLYAQLAAGLGFLILIGAAVTVWFSNSTTTAITTGTLGVFGGSLGAYVGSTFMKVQQGAADQLRQYFDHPLELSKILIAERLIESLPADQRTVSVQQLTQAIVTGGPSSKTDSSEPRSSI